MARNYEEAIPLFKRSLSELEKLVASHPTDQRFREYLGRSNDSLGICFSEQGQHEDAEGYYRRSRDLFAELHKDSPERPWFMTLLAIAESRLANVLRRSGRVEEAKAAFLRTIELHRKAIAKDPGDRTKLGYLALALTEAGAQDALDRLKAYQEAIEILRGLVEDYPEMPDHLEALVVVQRNYCNSLYKHQRFADMLPVARSAVENGRKLEKYSGKPDYREQLVGAIKMLHYALLVNGLQQEAAALRLDSIQEIRNYSEYRPGLGSFLREVAGDLYFHGRQSREAIELMEESIAEQPDTAGPFAWIVLALAHARLGDMETAKTWLEKLLPLPQPEPKSEIPKELFDEAIEVFDLSGDSISSK
jgi:tetratricopeptide (TPR) repeat protein